MTPDDLAKEKARALRLLESAAASAINNGASPEEVDARVKTGVDAAMANPYNIEQRKAAAAQ